MATVSNLLIVFVMMTTLHSIFAAHGTYSNRASAIVAEIDAEENEPPLTKRVTSKITGSRVRRLCDDVDRNDRLVRISTCIKFVHNMHPRASMLSVVVSKKDKMTCSKVPVEGSKKPSSVKMFKCPDTIVTYAPGDMRIEKEFLVGQSRIPTERTVRAFRLGGNGDTYGAAQVLGQLKDFEFDMLNLEEVTDKGREKFTDQYAYHPLGGRSNERLQIEAGPSSPSNYPGSTKYIQFR